MRRKNFFFMKINRKEYYFASPRRWFYFLFILCCCLFFRHVLGSFFFTSCGECACASTLLGLFCARAHVRRAFGSLFLLLRNCLLIQMPVSVHFTRAMCRRRPTFCDQRNRPRHGQNANECPRLLNVLACSVPSCLFYAWRRHNFI